MPPTNSNPLLPTGNGSKEAPTRAGGTTVIVAGDVNVLKSLLESILPATQGASAHSARVAKHTTVFDIVRTVLRVRSIAQYEPF